MSSVFASELDHSSRNFVGHTQTQVEEVVREAFERTRALFAEAADTTAAAFMDEVQRTGRQELDGFGEELRRSKEEARSEMNLAREELARRVTSEQQEFLRRFQAGMGGALEAGVADARKKVEEGFEPLLASWKSMTDAHQKEMERGLRPDGRAGCGKYKSKLETFRISGCWRQCLAGSPVAGLDFGNCSDRRRKTPRSLRACVCGDRRISSGTAKRDRFGFTAPDSPARAKSANSGS